MGGVKHEKKRGLKNLNPWVKKLNHGLKIQKIKPRLFGGLKFLQWFSDKTMGRKRAAEQHPVVEIREKRTRSGKTTWAHQIAMLEWLEDANGRNLDLIRGKATSSLHGTLAGAKLTKEDAYKAITDYVNQKCGTNWTYKSGKSRYKNYFKLYKETVRKYDSKTGAKYFLSAEDIGKGLTTIALKLNVRNEIF